MIERRTKPEIIKDILRVIYEKNGKIKPTHILYKSNLSYVKMKTYITELIDKKLIKEEQNNKNKTYTITEEGIKFLGDYERITEFMKSFGL